MLKEPSIKQSPLRQSGYAQRWRAKAKADYNCGNRVGPETPEWDSDHQLGAQYHGGQNGRGRASGRLRTGQNPLASLPSRFTTAVAWPNASPWGPWSLNVLTIREEQFRALARADWERFEADMVRHLRSRFAHVIWDLDVLRLCQLVRDGAAEARALRLFDETDVRRYLEYVIQFGSRWYEKPEYGEVAAIITMVGEDGTERMTTVDLLMARKQGWNGDGE